MISDPTDPTGSRLFFFDNLRVFLLLLVITLHSAQPYGPAGWHYWLEQPDRFDFSFTFVVLGLYFAVSSSFFMGLFFLISGYFVPQSYDRKGERTFLKDRLLRLGVPLLVFVLGVMPLFMYVLCYLRSSEQFPSSWNCVIQTFEFHHLWFIAQLLMFNIGYVIWRRLISDRSSNTTTPQTVPGNRTILSFLVGLTLVTFTIRIWIPAIKWDPVGLVEFARLPQYLSLFGIGILASRRGWVLDFPSSTGLKWLGIGIVTILSLPALFFAGGGMDPLLGGLHWQAFVFAAWEAVVGVSMAISLVVLFRDKLNKQGNLGRTLAANVYTVYLIHIPIVVFLQSLLVTVGLHSLLKVGLILLVGVPLCFLLGHYFVRRLPLAKRIL